MIYDIYPLEESNSSSQFDFYSVGPNGKIKKRIVFINDIHRIDTVHVGFGDINEDNSINARAISNNNDSKRILLTVAFAIYKFLKIHSGKYVLAIGNTATRTRLYQIAICNNREIINRHFEIYGLIKNKWKLFERGVQYKAFLFKQKIK